AIDLAVTFTPEGGRTIAVDDWGRRDAALRGAGLLVNSTSLGMQHQPALELDLAVLPATAVVNDLVYVPLRTDLLRRAAARGNPTVDGLNMLLHQGRPGFAGWFGGPQPPVTPAQRAAVAADLGA
ncbi:MAG TPA: shikimate dehydrogenase, partial [Vineibacter sp.]|nr:shikimate dehydrogenase [Vineibacter sp.]